METKQNNSGHLLSVLHDGKEIIVPQAKFTIGARGYSDVCIDDGSVTRRHIQVECEQDGFTVQDLGSDNGVYLLAAEGQSLDPYRVKEALHVKHSCTLHIGQPLITVKFARRDAQQLTQSLTSQEWDHTLRHYPIRSIVKAQVIEVTNRLLVLSLPGVSSKAILPTVNVSNYRHLNVGCSLKVMVIGYSSEQGSFILTQDAKTMEGIYYVPSSL